MVYLEFHFHSSIIIPWCGFRAVIFLGGTEMKREEKEQGERMRGGKESLVKTELVIEGKGREGERRRTKEEVRRMLI